MYSEETDLCFRLKRSGWPVYLVPQAEVLHHGGQSSRQMALQTLALLYRSKVLFFRRHYGPLRAAQLQSDPGRAGRAEMAGLGRDGQDRRTPPAPAGRAECAAGGVARYRRMRKLPCLPERPLSGPNGLLIGETETTNEPQENPGYHIGRCRRPMSSCSGTISCAVGSQCPGWRFCPRLPASLCSLCLCYPGTRIGWVQESTAPGFTVRHSRDHWTGQRPSRKPMCGFMAFRAEKSPSRSAV